MFSGGSLKLRCGLKNIFYIKLYSLVVRFLVYVVDFSNHSSITIYHSELAWEADLLMGGSCRRYLTLQGPLHPPLGGCA